MAKYKPKGSHKPEPKKSNARAIPCAILLLLGIAMISFLFYELLKSGI